MRSSSGDVRGSCTKMSAFEVETKPLSVFGDPVASHDQQEWIEGDRNPSLPYTGGRIRGRAEIKRESINFMEHHLDEGMKEVC